MPPAQFNQPMITDQETPMQLHYMPSSPYVRKVCVCAIEAGVDELIERVDTDIRDKESGIRDANPLGKVPAMRLKNGDVLFDSVVICEFLDNINEDSRLFPGYGPERWDVLRQHAQANGIIDAVWIRRREGIRDAAKRSESLMRHQVRAINAALDAFEKEVPAFSENPNIATITLGVAMGYMDFRMPEMSWRDDRPALTDWYMTFSERPSMRDTMPEDAK
ncbi:MAG: glutathione S-transferase family protein [Rhodospirillaceae bacterium]|jgi:glutathione S-transferase|nr:glutathione S-transferase family protein [Rhodospirillaceae bacterium]MBT3908887.1 glutathione S-transferase family protein [Rhodospirillaceae bacterium]MBT5297201.1 glutathione S-transferase family protein [Rhodospirillaceae bacterium]MBT5514376.1 glutathione S-transferase family protein [Rhodospirillaceae bacterium]MBT6087014.1 glutathione S-transferase family protein [Rhodospirillaceae bacterium]